MLRSCPKDAGIIRQGNRAGLEDRREDDTDKQPRTDPNRHEQTAMTAEQRRRNMKPERRWLASVLAAARTAPDLPWSRRAGRTGWNARCRCRALTGSD